MRHITSACTLKLRRRAGAPPCPADAAAARFNVRRAPARAATRGRARQGRLHRRHRQPDLRRARRARAALRRRRCSRSGCGARSACCCVMHDSIDLPVAFLGALYAGVVPVRGQHAADRRRLRLHAASTAARRRCSSRARCWPALQAALRGAPHDVAHVIVVARRRARCPPARARSRRLLAATRRSPTPRRHARRRHRASGSIRRARPAGPRAPCTRTPTCTGPPSSTARRCSACARTTSCFSAAKLFFAYGLGNALTFPLSVGATDGADGRAADARRGVQALDRAAAADGVLRRADAATPACSRRPTCRRATRSALRLCSSAGEALPREIGERFTAHFGCDILDGIGSTEMLHIFLSNRPGDVRYGTHRQAGARLRASSCAARTASRCADGEIGDLLHPRPERGADVLGQPREDRAPRSRARGPRAATSTRATPTATTSTPAAATTC